MILTVTMNPSLDKTVELGAPLLTGAVQRARSARTQPGGKGINVSTALAAAGQRTCALFPAEADDTLLRLLSGCGFDLLTVPTGAPVRTNTALVGPDGTTTKINEPGTPLTAEHLARLTEAVTGADAQTVVLAGSLPPGAPSDLYPQLIERIRAAAGTSAPLIALDTSEAPLRSALDPRLPAERLPDLIKPNGEELASILTPEEIAALPLPGGADAADPKTLGEALEADPQLAAEAAAALVRRGVGQVLATLGGSGAVLVNARGAWHAKHAPITVRSTVGAGDSSLAGFLLGTLEADDDAARRPEACLRLAVAYGSAAASLPGTTIPTPADVAEEKVSVSALTAPALLPAAV